MNECKVLSAVSHRPTSLVASNIASVFLLMVFKLRTLMCQNVLQLR